MFVLGIPIVKSRNMVNDKFVHKMKILFCWVLDVMGRYEMELRALLVRN